jgi:hypothetical protein
MNQRPMPESHLLFLIKYFYYPLLCFAVRKEQVLFWLNSIIVSMDLVYKPVNFIAWELDLSC